MARINIEASAGMAWLMEEGHRRGKRGMAILCAKAIDYLLDPRVGPDVEIGPRDALVLFSLPHVRQHAKSRLQTEGGAPELPGAGTAALRRRLGNLIVHHAWRQGAEVYHGGTTEPLGVDHARFTPDEAVGLEHRILDHMAAGTELIGHGLGGRAEEMRLTLAVADASMLSVSGWSDVEVGRPVSYTVDDFLRG